MAVDYNHIVSKHYRFITQFNYPTGHTLESKTRLKFLLGMPSWLTPEQQGRCVATDRGWELIPNGQTMNGPKSAELIKSLPGLATLLDASLAGSAKDIVEDPTGLTALTGASGTYTGSTASLQDFVSEIVTKGSISATQTTSTNITFTSIGVTRRSKRRYTINLTLEEPVVAHSAAAGATILVQPTFNTPITGTTEAGTTLAAATPHDVTLNVPDGDKLQFGRIQFPVEFSDDMADFGPVNLNNVNIVLSNVSPLVDTQGHTVVTTSPILGAKVTGTALGYGL